MGSVTGGSNGVIGVWPPPPFDQAWVYFLLTLALAVDRRAAVAAFSVCAVRLCDARRPRSPLRAEAIGIDVKRVHWLGFAIAGGVCGIAGGLFAFAKGSISPETIHVGRSIDGLVMVLLGGIQTLTGPIVGAIRLRRAAGHGDAADRILAGVARRHHPAAGAGFPAGGIVGAFIAARLAQAGAKRMSVLAVRALSKAFGGVHAVNDVSFESAKASFSRMIGPNGAGKSTCFNMINGQLTPDSGEILFAGREHRRPARRARSGGSASAARSRSPPHSAR